MGGAKRQDGLTWLGGQVAKGDTRLLSGPEVVGCFHSPVGCKLYSRRVSKEVAKMTKSKKCANPACTCVPSDGEKYCSAHCEGIGKGFEVMCRCGHSDCGTDTSSTSK